VFIKACYILLLPPGGIQHLAIITLQVIVPGRCTCAKQQMNVIKVYLITAIIAAKKIICHKKRAARAFTAGFAFLFY
jgi:hypothetical protein